MTNPREQRRICSLIALPGARLENLRRQLEARQVVCLTVDEAHGSRPVIAALVLMLRRSDFVSCILPANPQPNLFFELGIAMGLSKPLLLFAESSWNVPFDLHSQPFIAADLISSEELDKFLDAFIRTLPPSPPKKRKNVERKSPRKASVWRGLRSELSLIQSSSPTAPERRMEELIKRAFQWAGFSVTAAPEPDLGADFAVVSPVLNRVFGSPILVEVKAKLTPAAGQAHLARLSQLLEAKNGGAGVVVTSEEADRSPFLHPPQQIAITSAIQLLGWLEAGSFAEELALAIGAPWRQGQ